MVPAVLGRPAVGLGSLLGRASGVSRTALLPYRISVAYMSTEAPRPPLPPFTFETAREKVRLAEAAWNTCDPEKVALAYTPDCPWRNRSEFFQGREAIKAFLRRKWEKELDYCLMKELWAYNGNRIAARFEYEYRTKEGQWFRAHGNEQWEFNEQGIMTRRDASINDVPIKEEERRYRRDPKTGLVVYKDHPSWNAPTWKRRADS